jgi:ketosteroid isomerase-like protein
MPQDLEDLRARDEEWAALAAAGKDVDQIVSFWSDDAVVIPPAMPAIVGKDAIRQYVADTLAIPGFSITWEATQFEVAAEGGLAYGVGTNRVTFPTEDGELRAVEGRAVTVWRKESGEWRCVVDIWNDAPPSE